MKKGFTVLETIVAIMVVSMAIAGATLAARGGIRAGSIAKEEVKAFYLSQEVLEFLNNKRDTNELTNRVDGTSISWLTGIETDVNGNSCTGLNKCYLDMWGVGGLVSCGATCPVIKQNKNDYRYGHVNDPSFWKNTVYTREINIEKNAASTEIQVNIKVSWNHAGTNMELKTKTLLTNWYNSSTSE
jgi:prepilin-type N-terminal cleavage/methylation domain-containing protein